MLFSSTDAMNPSSILFGIDNSGSMFIGFETINKNGDVITKVGVDN